MTVLTVEQAGEKLRSRPDWKLEGKEIARTWTFDNFVQAMEFVNAAAEQAEAAGHHPDIDIRYNKVRLALVSHDAGGLTALDFEMAASFDDLASKVPPAR